MDHRTTPRVNPRSLALTFDVDVDEVWNEDASSGRALPVDRSQGLYDVRRGVPDVLERLREHRVGATFFVLGRVAERFPALIDAIVADGHEIASHGHTHRSPVGLSAAEQREELERSQEAFARFDVTVAGYRSPSWDLADETLDLLPALGFRYSSNQMDDIRPYRHESSLVEIPVHWSLDDAAHFWFAGSTWNKKISTKSEVREIWSDELHGIADRDGTCVFTFHPQIIGRPGRIGLIDEMITLGTELGYEVRRCVDVAALVETGALS